MKVANPQRPLGQVMADAGQRPHGWYDIDTICGVVQGCYPDVVEIDVMDAAGLERLTGDMKRAEVYPWRYVVDKVGEMVRVRAVRQAVNVPETGPQRLGSRAWEADPRGFFDTGRGIVLADSEHDPRLGPDYGDDD